MRRSALLIIISLFLIINISGSLNAQVNTNELDTYFSQMQEDWNIPSISIGVVKDGKIVYKESFGTKRAGKNKKPNEATLYAIASNSKAFTATIIAMLVEEGLLNWNDKVKDYLPYFELYDPWVSNNITILDMLSHRSGLGTFSGDIMWYKSDLSSEDIIRRAANLPKTFEFRSGFGYSNIMYIVAGELIKEVTGKTWGENVQERILDPLGMERTIYSLNELEAMGNYAVPHALDENKNIEIPWVDWEEVGALGGLISSVEDVSKWMIFNMGGGVWNGDTLLTNESLSRLWTPYNNFMVSQFSESAPNTHFRGYGLGWGLADYYGNLRVSHTGGYDGMITAVTMIPDKKLGVVVLTNGMNSPITAATNYALEKYLEVEVNDWSSELLERSKARENADTRIEDRKAGRVNNTSPSLPLNSYVGKYQSDIYGEIDVILQNNELKLKFEYTEELSATLTHWHYDVWKIEWEYPHAWFSFGTVSFKMNNNLEIKGMDFDVPNNDIFFEELKPYRIQN